MRMTKQDVAGVLLRELAQARGYDSDELATKRKQALQYYLGELPAAPERTGRSQIVSMDVADSLHSLLAQIMPIVKSTIVEWEPQGEQDELPAQTESDFVRALIERSDGYATASSAIHDALLTGNGWLYVYVEESEQVAQERYPAGLSDIERMVITAPRQEGQTVEVEETDAGLQLTRTTPTRKLRVDAIPPESMLYSATYGAGQLHEQRLVAQRRLITVSELVETFGIALETATALPDAEGGTWGAEAARDGIWGRSEAAQEAEQLKEVFDCYIRLDMTGKGISELRRVWLGGNEVLRNEPADWIPYVTGSAVPVPHKVAGLGIYELLKSVQDGKSEVLRNYLDNLSVMNASRVAAVEGQVNMGDLTNGRINGVVRVRSPDAVVPLPSSDIGPQAMLGLDYLDKVRVQRVGSAVDLNELQAQIMKSSATAAAGQLAQVEQMCGWYASNLIQTLIKPLYLLVHKTAREQMQGAVGAKIGGKWAQTDPGQWQPRELLQVTMGMTTAEKAARISALTQILGQQQQALQTGGAGVITDNAKIYAAMCDWIRANDIGNPTEYLIDPRSPEAQQAQQAQAQQQQQAQQQAQQQQQQFIQAQQQFELQKQAQELEYKRWADLLDAQIQEAKITQQGLSDVMKLSQQAQAAAQEVSDANG